MAEFIQIEWLDGRPLKGADRDEARAVEAAEAVLDQAGVRYVEAYDAYCHAIDSGDDMNALTGPALVWSRAENAADAALTEGWHNPGGAHCSISAWAS